MNNIPILPNYIYKSGSAFVNVPIGQSLAVCVIGEGFANIFTVGVNGARSPMPVNPNALANQSLICTPAMIGATTTCYIEAVGGQVEWAVGSPRQLLSNLPAVPKVALGNNTFIQPNDSGSVLGAQIVTAGLTLAYAPNDVLSVVGGTSTATAQLKVLQTTVIGYAIVAGGSGGTNGGVQLSGTTGAGQEKFILNGTIAGGILTAITSIYRPGKYTTNPTNVLIEPVTGGGLVGTTVSLIMGIASVIPVQQGIYSVLPSNPVTFTGGAGGTGFTANLTFLPPIPQITVKISASPTVFATSDIAGGTLVPFTDSRIYVGDKAAWYLGLSGTYGSLYFPRDTIGYQAAKAGSVSFLYDGNMFELMCRGGDLWQCFVDQMDGRGYRLINPYLTLVPNGSGDKPAFIKYNFGYRSLRKILLTGETSGVGGVTIEATGTLAALDFTQQLTANTWAFIGNSYGQLVSDAFPSGPQNEVISRLSGFVIYKDCEGGSGYNVGNGGGPHPYPTRLSPLIAAAPANVLIDSPINDTTGAAYNSAVTNFYATLFSGLPNANFQIWGCVTPPSQTTGVGLADCQSRSAVILNVLLQYPNTSWVFLDYSTGLWTKSNGNTGYFCNPTGIFTGTGHIGATAGNGNSDLYIGSADTTHPAPIGCSYLGRMASVGYAAALNAG